MAEIAGRLVWDKTGEHYYETGVDHGVLSTIEPDGTWGRPEVWNGLVSVSENPSGAEASPSYADNIKYLNMISAEDFGLTIEAFTYPKKFGECDGSAEVYPGVFIGQQARKSFNFHYRTKVGNDVAGDSLGYKLHFAYNCLAAPSERPYSTISDSPEPNTFSWEVTTTPTAVSLPNYRPTALVTIDSTSAPADKLAELEDIIYGKNPTSDTADDGVEPRFPTIDEVLSVMKPTI